MRAGRWLVVALAAAGLWIASVPPAAAHPLGNFTVNRFSALELASGAVTIRYAVDMAEIPTFQERRALDANGDGRSSDTELAAYARAKARAVVSNLTVSADGEAVQLTYETSSADLSKGQAGLDVLRLDAVFTGAIDSPASRIEYSDDNFSDRLGWSEVVATAAQGHVITFSTVPARSVSDGLRSYPEDMLSSPPSVHEAVVELDRGAARATDEGAARTRPSGSENGLTGRFTSLIGHELSPMFLLFALAVAFGAGALHALGPGHGKSIMAAYLVGIDGRLRHAVAVGVAVSLMHTASVVVLGLAVLGASRLFTPEAVFPRLSLVSGVVVLTLGVYLLRTRLAARRHHLHHNHVHDHDHDHDHDHGHGHGHTHTPAVSPTSWRGLGAIALSGGLLPSPSALVVLLGAVALHRVAFGVVLVAAFSVGLATALTIVGALVIKARAVATRRFGQRVTVQLPVLSAVAILAIGTILTAGAVTRL